MAEGDRRLARVRHSRRRRVAVVFAAAVVVTALAMALSAYYLTKAAQDDEALEKALAQSRFNLFLADTMLPADPDAADYDRLLEAFQIRGDFATLIEAGGETYVSGPQVTRDLVTPALASKVTEGRVGFQMIELAGQPAIAVGGEVRSPSLRIYNFYPQGDRLAELERLRDILIIAGVVLAILGAVAGYWLARRLTGPVRRASKAAVQMSQGDLDIRLPTGSDEFGVLGASFNRMAENLQAKIQDLEAGQARERRFVADVAHELRTPVSALVGETSLLKSKLQANLGECPPEVRKLALMVGADISRLRQLVDDLLEVSRLDAGAAETVIETVDVEPFLARLVNAHGWSDVVRILVEEVQPSTADSCGECLPGGTIQTDRRRLERIIVNLLENALVHGAAPVTIEAGREVRAAVNEQPSPADLIYFAVTDNGPGIPEEHLAHVFDRFYKADPSRASGRGSGLGLAIARENARLLGGNLNVVNLPNAGARFTLTLPSRNSAVL